MMRPHVSESRRLADEGSWSGDAVQGALGIYLGPDVYPPGSDAYRALDDNSRGTYIILVSTGEHGGNQFRLELDEAPPSYAPVTVRFEWMDGPYLPGVEKTAIRVAFGDGVGDHGLNATPIGPQQWETVIRRPNPSDSRVMRLYTASGEARVLHVWSVEVAVDSPARDLRPLRQRQSLIGGGSWPLRQRQNGAHSGSWPLRQRHAGV